MSVFLLVGCQTDNDISSTTPEEALHQVHVKESYAKPLKIYEVIEIEKGRVLAIYKGEMDDVEDMYAANLEGSNGEWLVTDATSIGMPSIDKLNQSSATESFEAGYTRDEASPSENLRIVTLEDSEFNVWIEVF